MSLVISASRDCKALDLRLLKERVPLSHPSIPFVVFWSQKAACTTVVKWFFFQAGLLADALRHSSWIHDYRNEVFVQRQGYLDDLYARLQDGVPVVKFVRDPYTRAYSSYLAACHRETPRQARAKTMSLRRQALTGIVGDTIESDYAFSFRQFLQWVGRTAAEDLDAHIRPQHLPRDDFFDVRVLKIESLSENLQALEREFRLPKASRQRPELFESAHFRPKAALSPATSLALLDLGVPSREGPDFQFVPFAREMARGTPFEELIERCFGTDLELYAY